MIRIQNLKLRHEGRQDDDIKQRLIEKAAKRLRITPAVIEHLVIRRHAVDARRKPAIFDVYTVDVSLRKKKEAYVVKAARDKQVSLVANDVFRFPAPAPAGTFPDRLRPVITGFGPAGMFCALELARAGFRPIVIERGRKAPERLADVRRFFEGGMLRPDSNVQFGEGGAGTFSDGKLSTGISDPSGRVRHILETFVSFGAPDDILYESMPHIGTDLLTDIVAALREEIITLGGEVRFETTLSSFSGRKDGTSVTLRLSSGAEEPLATPALVLAIGHSARDTYRMLYDSALPMAPKPFAVGLRIQHPQSLIDEAMYGEPAPHTLPPASYKLTTRAADGRGVYSFCMCPGGFVINAASEAGFTVVNGMSERNRASTFANSAIVVTVSPDDYGKDHVLNGMNFQYRLEEAAYRAGNGLIPVMTFHDFKAAVTGGVSSAPALLSQTPCTRGGFCFSDLRHILPDALNLAVAEAMPVFGKRIPGFDDGGALLFGVESRTSAPVRILRDDTLCSPANPCIFPCGEGAGYAGGIMSAAVDGIRVAEAVAKRLSDMHRTI